MSVAKNNITRSVSPKTIFADAQAVVTSAVSFNQGDLLVFDDTNNRLKVPSAEAEALTFVGVAVDTIVSGIIKRPYVTAVDASQAAGALQGPMYGVVVSVQLKSGDAVVPGDLLYLDPASGAQNVSVTGTKAIGVYQGSALTAGASTYVEVLLGSRFPADALKF
jgi:acetyl/propionyl-CoA carboxylase alpha subunit